MTRIPYGKPRIHDFQLERCLVCNAVIDIAKGRFLKVEGSYCIDCHIVAHDEMDNEQIWRITEDGTIASPPSCKEIGPQTNGCGRADLKQELS